MSGAVTNPPASQVSRTYTPAPQPGASTAGATRTQSTGSANRVGNAGRLSSPASVRTRVFSNALNAVARVGRTAVDVVRAGFNAIKEMHAARKEAAAQREADKADCREAVEQFLDTNLNLELTNPSGDIHTLPWRGALFKDMLDGIPKEPKEAFLREVNNLPDKIRTRFGEASAVFNQVTNPNMPLPEPTLENISNFTLYLYAKADAQGDGFMEGAFNIKDPNGRIASWLDSCTEVYTRSSSHLSGIQGEDIPKAGGGVHRNTPRGIDLPKTPDTGLPDVYKTITYGTITPLSGNQNDRRLFLKAESFGCRLNSLAPWHAREGSSGIHSRGKRFSDIKPSLGHTFSYFTTRGHQNDLNCRKEHFPKDLAKVLKKWSGKKGISPEAKQLISIVTDCGCEKGGIGLRLLNAKLANLRMTQNTQFNADVSDFLGEVDIAIHEFVPNQRNMDVRLGNEVIIN